MFKAVEPQKLVGSSFGAKKTAPSLIPSAQRRDLSVPNVILPWNKNENKEKGSK